MHFLRFAAAALALVCFSCGDSEPVSSGPVSDIVKAAPDRAKLLLENEQLLVMQFTLASQAELPMHEGRDRVVYSLSDYKLQFIPQDGTPVVRDFRKGDAHWHSSGMHSVKNIGPIPAEFLVVARKAPNPTPGVTSNLAELAPASAKVVFENQDAKVLEVSLKPGEKQPVHNGAARLVYSLTPARVRFTAGKESTEHEYAAGAVHYHAGGPHRVENLSKEPIRYVVIEVM
ncbi:MAG: hypothetical protein IT158_13730 [Bryobacterales bacterium]|nr:hypothetical protein [Bryobacterales bacterium]